METNYSMDIPQQAYPRIDLTQMSVFLAGLLHGAELYARSIEPLPSENEKVIPAPKTDSSREITDMIDTIIIDCLKQIPEVVAIYKEEDNDILRIWSLINEKNKHSRKAIYQKELEILKEIPYISFDFHVIMHKDEREKSAFLPETCLIFQR